MALKLPLQYLVAALADLRATVIGSCQRHAMIGAQVAMGELHSTRSSVRCVVSDSSVKGLTMKRRLSRIAYTKQELVTLHPPMFQDVWLHHSSGMA
jgi:hypothetical protein